MNVKSILAVMIQAAQAGGRQTVRFFGKRFTERDKAFGDVVTQADLAADEKIVSLLRRHFPAYNIISEERDEINNGSRYTFVIDPLDGTANFKINSPLFSTSIALVKDQTIVAGVVYAPVTKETFWAIKNRGAFKNGRRIRVARSVAPSRAIVGYSQGWKVDRQRGWRAMNQLWHQRFYRVVNQWSPALDLCRLAEGKIHGLVINGADLHDVAAGKLIAREAGAKILQPWHGHRRNIRDTDTTFIAVTSRPLAKKLETVSNILKK